MNSKAQFRNSTLSRTSHAATAALAMAILLALAVALMPAAQAQTFTVIHTFTGRQDGGWPQAGLTIDAAGNFYGTTSEGGFTPGDCNVFGCGECATFGCGTVFKLTRKGSGWLLTPLYMFAGGNDGFGPRGRVALAEDGTLYGTTYGGGGDDWGTVFHLTFSPAAPKSALARWNETLLVRFTAGNGQYPSGDLIFDPSGNIYGTAELGGGGGGGVIYELTPSSGGWTQTILYSPTDYYKDGWAPGGGVIFDRSGNLYGVFQQGGQYGYGRVYELSPSASGWTEQTLYTFTGGSDGAYPSGGLISDASGNLYGTASAGGAGKWSGTVFELTPANGGGWTFNLLYSFPANNYCGIVFGNGPYAALAMDAAGNLYGTTFCDGANNAGSVFKLTPSSGGWAYTSLHDFTGGSDGALPYSSVVFDAAGNLYGTAEAGGTHNAGVVWEITP